MDGDGDMDILSASRWDDSIRLYRNRDVTDSSFTVDDFTTVYSNARGAFSVYAADMDGDGDMDILSASYDDNSIR